MKVDGEVDVVDENEPDAGNSPAPPPPPPPPPPPSTMDASAYTAAALTSGCPSKHNSATLCATPSSCCPTTAAWPCTSLARRRQDQRRMMAASDSRWRARAERRAGVVSVACAVGWWCAVSASTTRHIDRSLSVTPPAPPPALARAMAR